MPQTKNTLMSIGEVANALHITRRIILNYETKGLIQPDLKENKTGNRYYTVDSLTRIRTIRIMQNLGLSLDEIYAYYNGMTDLEPLIARLETLRDEISLNIEKLKERAKAENDFKIQTRVLPAQTVYCKTLYADTVEQRKEHLRTIVTSAIRQYGTDTSKRMFFNQYSLSEPNLISYCVSVPPESQGENILNLPEEKALCIFYHGSYESFALPINKILTFAKENHLLLKGICRNIFLEGPPQHKDPDKFITQITLLMK